MNWIETETERREEKKKKNHLEKNAIWNENGEMRVLLMMFRLCFVMHRMERKKSMREKKKDSERNKNDYCLTSEKAEIKL